MSESNIKHQAQGALSHPELIRVLEYIPETGLFYWNIQRSSTALVGDQAGTIHSKLGYTTITYRGFRYQAHRLAWFYVYGYWPKGIVDHIDRDSTNNCISNLRCVSQSVNMHNTLLRSDNSSGYKGVSYMKKNYCWRARINIKGREIHLGTFRSKEEAIKARRDAEEKFLT